MTTSGKAPRNHADLSPIVGTKLERFLETFGCRGGEGRFGLSPQLPPLEVKRKSNRWVRDPLGSVQSFALFAYGQLCSRRPQTPLKLWIVV